MQKLFLILFSFLVISFISGGCSEKSEDNVSTLNQSENIENTDIQDHTLPELASLKGDTIHIYGKYILFYGPDETDMIAYGDNDNDLNAFMALSEKIMEEYNSKGEIPSSFTAANNIRIYTGAEKTTMVVTRKNFPDKYGFLITDGNQPPRLRNGPITEEQCYEIIRNYFFLPS